MSQFSPPPAPPAFTPAAHAQQPRRPAPWSVCAITAFILSLLGCLLVPAVLAIVLAIVGIFATRSERKRGMGLAIAALPIALVSAAVGTVMLFAFLFAGNLATATKNVEALLSSDATASVAGARGFFSDSFRDDVSVDALQTWVRSVTEKHGKLTADLSVGGSSPPNIAMDPDGSMRVIFEGRFVNGPAPIQLEFLRPSTLKLTLDDVQVDGDSPRAQQPAKSTP